MATCATGRLLRSAAVCAATLLAGCGGTTVTPGGSSEQLLARLSAAIGVVQIEDPRFIALPDAAIQRGDIVSIDPDAIQITTVEQLVVNPLPDMTVLALKSISGFDIFIRYIADGEPQAVFVYDNETLVLQYPCIRTLEFVTQDEFEPVTGLFVDTFPVSTELLNNPVNFTCGDAIVLAMDAEGVVPSTQVIPLTP